MFTKIAPRNTRTRAKRYELKFRQTDHTHRSVLTQHAAHLVPVFVRMCAIVGSIRGPRPCPHAHGSMRSHVERSGTHALAHARRHHTSCAQCAPGNSLQKKWAPRMIHVCKEKSSRGYWARVTNGRRQSPGRAQEGGSGPDVPCHEEAWHTPHLRATHI